MLITHLCVHHTSQVYDEIKNLMLKVCAHHTHNIIIYNIIKYKNGAGSPLKRGSAADLWTKVQKLVCLNAPNFGAFTLLL